jgi:cell division protease FtsH
MDGREPAPPKDWLDGKKPKGGTGGDKPRGESPIGGPAVQPRVRIGD